MTRTTAYAVLSRAVAAQRNGSAPDQVARLDAALAVAGEVLLAAESPKASYIDVTDDVKKDHEQAMAYVTSMPLLPVKPDGN